MLHNTPVYEATLARSLLLNELLDRFIDRIRLLQHEKMAGLDGLDAKVRRKRDRTILRQVWSANRIVGRGEQQHRLGQILGTICDGCRAGQRSFAVSRMVRGGKG